MKKVNFKVEEIATKHRDIFPYMKYKSIPKELQIDEKFEGKMLEVAGEPATSLFKLKEVRDNYAIVIDENGQWHNYSYDRIMLHRNEKMRNKTMDILDLYLRRKKKKK